MKKHTQKIIRFGVMLLVAVGLVVPAGFTGTGSVQAASFFPGAVCQSGTCDLWAKAGTITMPDGAVIPIWGFAPDAGSPPTLPGPTLIADEGSTINVVLHNSLAGEMVSLDFLGMPLVPDLTGVASGGTRTYTLTLNDPGTFLYQAGMTSNGARQVAMGLFGAIVVRPAGAPDQAYADPATAFMDEALLVFSEIDPLFNANPNAFLMEDFNPRYWLINGKSFPQTDPYTFDAGRTVLFRYVNAGFDHHAIGLLGLREMVLGKDATPLLFPYAVNTEIMGAGQTMDVMVQVPASAVTGKKYLLYETSLLQHNADQRLVAGGPVAVGGMLTSITVTNGTPAPAVGPVVARAQVNPSTTTGGQGVVLTITLGAGAVGMEYFIDLLGLPGTGLGASPYKIFLPIATTNRVAVPGPAPVPPAGNVITVIIPADVLAALPGGYHTFYIRAQDAGGIWGPVTSVVLNLDKVGPDATTLKLTSSPANGQLDVELTATGNDLHNGSAVVTGAVYSIDGGAPQPMIVGQPDMPIVALNATIPAATIAGLAEGSHTVSIRVTDMMGNTGAPSTIPLVVDKTGPVPGAIQITPTDFVVAAVPQVPTLGLRVTITDQGVVPSNLVAVKGFLRGTGAGGFDMFAVDGMINETTEEVWFDVPGVNFTTWGAYTLSVQAQDAAGNWGPHSSIRLLPAGTVIDTFLPLTLR